MCANSPAVTTSTWEFWDFFKCRCHGNTRLAMKHGFLITSVKMLQTAQNVTGLVTMQPLTHLSVLWGVIKWRCHGDRPLAMKHDVALSPMDTVQSSPNLHFYITSPCLNSSSPNLRSHHMPFPWKRIARHKRQCRFTLTPMKMLKKCSNFTCVLTVQPWRHLRESFEISSNAVAMVTQGSPLNTIFS